MWYKAVVAGMRDAAVEKLMTSRTRSPSYPSTPIEQAIEFARKLHQIERTNPVEREVAAKAMGYTGLSGRSATILSDLNQYGLLERTGKNEVRVTPLAVELLHPDDQSTWEEALRQAVAKPELFQRVMERFTDGLPSANALESYLVKQGFTFTAIPAAARAFRETYSYLENAIEGGRISSQAVLVQESMPDQRLDEAPTMNRPIQSLQAKAFPDHGKGAALQVIRPQKGAVVSFNRGQIVLGGSITTQAEADELLNLVNALKPMLAAAEPSQSDVAEPQVANEQG